jgi:hypothetical protein
MIDSTMAPPPPAESSASRVDDATPVPNVTDVPLLRISTFTPGPSRTTTDAIIVLIVLWCAGSLSSASRKVRQNIPAQQQNQRQMLHERPLCFLFQKILVAVKYAVPKCSTPQVC